MLFCDLIFASYIMPVQYKGGCVVQWETFSTLGEYNECSGGYHQYTLGGYYDKCEERSLGKQLNLYGNPSVMNIPQCTHDIPHAHYGIPSVY